LVKSDLKTWSLSLIENAYIAE